MMKWALTHEFPNVLFLCVCVDPNAKGTAQEFSKLYFKGGPARLINGFIDNQDDFPDFQAQLGCQGFVIFGPDHKIIESSSPPWTQYRDNAFKWMEGKLREIVNPSADPKNPMNAPIGQQVRILGLQSAEGKELNGQCGEVVGSEWIGRYHVKLQGQIKALKPGNLEDATGAPVGSSMRITGLTSEKGQALNGKIVEVLGGASEERWIVRLDTQNLSLQKINLESVATKMDTDDGIPSLDEGVPSVGHEAMDKQHESCEEALKTLQSKLTVQSLSRVQSELVEHFKEEEELMTSVNFGGARDGAAMSAYSSHVADHRKLLDMVETAMQSLQQACPTSEGTVPEEVARRICRAFMEHAVLYDSLYAEKVNSVPVH
mmetsp:Transcript_8562/g.15322  ORF Transcript_8562/g.15322 Transcript_8562/m.15322 type:complete len:374 (+) Transcript_8562:257-1378(+)